MNVLILQEAGYISSLFGLGLSYGLTNDLTYEQFLENDCDDMFNKLEKAASKLYNKDGGHNKFLESIQVWLDITAPRYWWSECDTYRAGVTKQSASTMHTILKKPFEQSMFEYPIPFTILIELERLRLDKKFVILKNVLPEGFLQRRIICLNYKVLRNMLAQRKDHKLIEWKYFCQYIYKNVEHPEFFDDIML